MRCSAKLGGDQDKRQLSLQNEIGFMRDNEHPNIGLFANLFHNDDFSFCFVCSAIVRSSKRNKQYLFGLGTV